MKYSFHPWHPYYLARAQQEVNNLKQLFSTAKIEHFGSTAIPNLGGKGIIDISMSVESDNFKPTFQAICKTDYDYRPSGGVSDERYFFQKTVIYPKGHKQLFHLHLTKAGDSNMKECLAFRDYLQTHPTLAKEYSDIKQKAVNEAKKYYKKAEKKKAYMEAKKPVIEKIILEMKNRL